MIAQRVRSIGSKLKEVSIAWVLGRGGLLGNAVVSKLEEDSTIWEPSRSIIWTDYLTFQESILNSISEFARDIQMADDRWIIYWCAGIATLGTEPDLNNEFSQIEFLLECLDSRLGEALSRGTLVYSSSAGGIYGGSSEELITENSAIAINSNYGDLKFRVENSIEIWSKNTGCRVAICRIANIYGPNQNFLKRQGFITAACLNLLLQRPLEIFVPLDTKRNYINARDAAHVIVGLANKVSQLPVSTVELKLVCSPHNLSLASLLRELRQVFGRMPPISLGQRSTTSLYVKNLSMNSWRHQEVEPEQFILPAIGIAEVRHHLLSRHIAMGLAH